MSRASQRLKRIERKVKKIEETEHREYVISGLPQYFKLLSREENGEKINWDKYELSPELNEVIEKIKDE